MSSLPTDWAFESVAKDRPAEFSDHAALVPAQAALEGLADMAAGRLVEGGELGKALAVVPPQPRLMG